MAVARITEIISSHPESFDKAVQTGLKRASTTLRGITGLEVSRFQVKVEKNRPVEYRVTLRITFVLED